MRWVVDLPAESGGTGASVTVDGDSWKSALSEARAGKPLAKFRCDFDDDGTVRVWDMATNERFVVRPFGTRPAQAPSAPRAASNAVPSSAGSTSVSTPPPAMPAQTPAPSTPTAPVEHAPAVTTPSSAATVSPSPSIVPPAPGSTVPSGATLLFSRNREPSATSPLSFRERLLTVPASTTNTDAERIGREMLTIVRNELSRGPAGQYVSIAVFDHAFKSKPERPPLVVVSWKDWRGDRADVQFPNARTASEKSVDAPKETFVPVATGTPSLPPDQAKTDETPVAIPTPTPISGSPVAPPAPISAAPPPRASVPPKTSSRPGFSVPMPKPSSPPPADGVMPDVSALAAPKVPTIESPAIADSKSEPSVVVAQPEPAKTEPAVVVAQPEPAKTEPAVVVAKTEPAKTEPAVVVAKTEPAKSEPSVVVAQPEPAKSEPSVVVAQPEPAKSEPSVVVAQPEPAKSEPSVVVAQPEPAKTEPATSEPGDSRSTESSIVISAEAAVPSTAPVAAPTPPAPAVAPSAAATLDQPRPSAIPFPMATASVASAPTKSRRKRGDELLTDAFEATQDYSFMSEVSEACTLTIELAKNLLGASATAIMVYDIDRDELVLEAVDGVQGAPGTRAPLAQGPRGESAIKNRVLMLSEPSPGDTLVSGSPSGPVLYVPLRHDRRLFGVLQLHRGGNESAFDADEQNAASYVAGQLAQFFADHSRRVGFKDDQAR